MYTVAEGGRYGASNTDPQKNIKYKKRGIIS